MSTFDERAADIRMGLPVQIVTSGGELIESTKVNFISQQVDNALQGILVKAPLHSSLDKFRNAQLVKARVVWSTAPAPTIPVLAVTRIEDRRLFTWRLRLSTGALPSSVP